ncbi:MAG: hypothetical protein WAU86_22460, partial [Oricola sp.]
MTRATMGALPRSICAAFVLSLALLASGCITEPGDPPALSSIGPAPSCCARPERYPAWLERLVEPGAPVLVPIIGSIEFRDGWLERHRDAQAHIAKRLRPLDVIAVVADGRASLVPGLFDHVAVYV